MIAKTAVDKTSFLKKIQLTNSAREGWELILRTLDSKAKVLLPSYIGVTDREGSGIYDPVTTVGLEHDFYLLNEDLSISIELLEQTLKTGDYKLILLVHYFGFRIQNIDKITKLCKKYNVITVEDCAHLYNYNLYNYSDAGTHGDFTFYSLHKYFPFENGGMYVQNNSAVQAPDSSTIKLSSELSSELMKYDIAAIANKRRTNFETLDKMMQGIVGVRPLKKMGEGDIPHNYPIVVENGLREKLYFWLIEKDLTLIALYYRLINPLQTEEYKSMQFLSSSILNLPIHQDITKKDIQFIVDLLKEGLIALKK
ncbi:MAG: hypothetical protein GY810_14640 [Aureispira sp.]|nr:hypothetical protein [Aureispira sp.]